MNLSITLQSRYITNWELLTIFQINVKGDSGLVLEVDRNDARRFIYPENIDFTLTMLLSKM